jgi:hypothetical protein
MAVGTAAWRVISAEWLRGRVPGDVVDHKQIEPSIVIVVEPSSGHCPAALRQSGASRYIFEGAVAAVSVECGPAQAGNRQVDPAVVVEIGRCHSHGISRSAHAGFGGHVGEGTVAIIVEQPVAEGGVDLLQAGHGSAVGNIDVGPAVVVVIENRNAAEHGLGKMLVSDRSILDDHGQRALFEPYWRRGGCAGHAGRRLAFRLAHAGELGFSAGAGQNVFAFAKAALAEQEEPVVDGRRGPACRDGLAKTLLGPGEVACGFQSEREAIERAAASGGLSQRPGEGGARFG